MHEGIEVSLNMNVRGLAQSATMAVSQRSREMKAEGKKVYRLGLGQSPFPIPDSVAQALRDNAHQNDYLPPLGLPALREAVAEYHRRNDGLDFQAENVIIGPGSKELMFIVQLVHYGELMVPTPCWVSYGPQARILGRNISLIRTSFEERWQVSAEHLEEHCAGEHDESRPRILILNYPGNPEGCDRKSSDLEQLAEVARKYRVILLSDEIYGPLHHKAEPEQMAARFTGMMEEAFFDFKALQIDRSKVQFARFADLRYQGQYHEIQMELPPGEITPAAIASVSVYTGLTMGKTELSELLRSMSWLGRNRRTHLLQILMLDSRPDHQ